MSGEKDNGHQDTSSTVLDPTMSLVGRLEDLSLGEILQIVSLSKRSGLLRLESPGGKASLYIKGGKVIYAATSEEKEGILTLFADNGLIQGDILDSLRENLDTAGSPQEFRDLLEERTGIGHEKLQAVLKTRVEELTYALFVWEEGTFSFQLIEDESKHPLLSKVAPFFLDGGIEAQFLVMEGARRKDEMLRDVSSAGGPDRSPMVDPGKVLGDDWEQEFEEHLSGPDEKKEETVVADDLEGELQEFNIPEILPELPHLLGDKVVVVGLPEPLMGEIAGSFINAGIDLLFEENGADALAKIQELRQQGLVPFLLIDIEAAGITDGRILGGLEVISTLWDFGFHLPVGLVCRREIQEDLEVKLQSVTGLTLFRLSTPFNKTNVQQIFETITAAMGEPSDRQEVSEKDLSPDVQVEDQQALDIPIQLTDNGEPALAEPGSVMDQGGDYYDIEQEFSDELGDIDLPMDGWDESQALPQEASLDPHMTRLSSYVNELNRQDIGGEITLLALRFASDFANRAILFLVRRDDIKGLGQFGVDLGQDQDADTVVRSLNVPLEENSLFERVARQRQSYKGPPTDSATEKALFKALGGGKPSEIFVGPIVSMGKVAVLLYGDDFPIGQGLEPTHTLDIFLSHVGLALDRAFLEMKLKSQRS